MKFPITSKIKPIIYGRKNANTLSIYQSSGYIPIGFQYRLLTEEKADCESGYCQLTDKQWSEWGAQDDKEYILSCVCENLQIEIDEEANEAAANVEAKLENK